MGNEYLENLRIPRYVQRAIRSATYNLYDGGGSIDRQCATIRDWLDNRPTVYIEEDGERVVRRFRDRERLERSGRRYYIVDSDAIARHILDRELLRYI